MSIDKKVIREMLDNMDEEDRQTFSELATWPVAKFYLLPNQQIDLYHRLFLRTITKNRERFIARLNAVSTETDDSEE